MYVRRTPNDASRRVWQFGDCVNDQLAPRGAWLSNLGVRMLLTKHEGEIFHNQTVYISGQAFIKCKFVACTLILRETLYHLQECTFERCNWHVDWVLMWGSPESLREIKALVNLIEQAQSQLPTAEQQAQEVQRQQPENTTPFAS